MPLFSKGIILDQHKEPILGSEILEYPSQAQYFENPYSDADSLTIEQLIEIARLANIIDEREGKPLADKLTFASKRGKPYGIIADAVDDEPYISSQLCLIIHKRELVVDGLSLCARALGIKNACIAVYKNLYDLSVRIPSTVGDIKIEKIQGKYPAETRLDTIWGKSRRKLIIGIGALVHLARAVRESRMQTTCFVTVAGNCVSKPANVELPIGTTAAEALDFCNLALDPTRVAVGGSMTGKSITDPASYKLLPSARSVLAFEDKAELHTFNCIGCSRCLEVCPQKLNPALIYKYMSAGMLDEIGIFDPTRCDECGTCSYTCPCELDLSVAVSRAKTYMLKNPAHDITSEDKILNLGKLPETIKLIFSKFKKSKGE